ncbi:PP144 [Orf virus]|uniref:PP144 n=1 Tax=Orf virus TaxID=10258 RepID=F1AWV6_ORFV|nr:PP144 [Orf virus]
MHSTMSGPMRSLMRSMSPPEATRALIRHVRQYAIRPSRSAAITSSTTFATTRCQSRTLLTFWCRTMSTSSSYEPPGSCARSTMHLAMVRLWRMSSFVKRTQASSEKSALRQE